MLNIEKIEENLSIINNLYDSYRVIDPIKKEVIKTSGIDNKMQDYSCFSFWQKGKVCENCISARAYLSNESYVKIEFNGEKIYMVTSLPVGIGEENTVILELLRDVTNTSIIDDIKGMEREDIYMMIDRRNSLLVKDELTDAYNRRFINERLPYEMLNCGLEGNHLALIMVDIDFFKKVNDTHGHLAGDYILKELVKLIKRNIREGQDWVARFGGEEFIVFLKHADNEIAYKIAEKLRAEVANRDFIYKDRQIKITISLGLATINNCNLTQDELIERADKNLYLAKSSGRNQVRC